MLAPLSECTTSCPSLIPYRLKASPRKRAAIAILLLEVLRLQSKYPWSFSNLIHNLRPNLLSFRLIEDWLNAPDQAVILVNAPAQQELFSTG